MNTSYTHYIELFTHGHEKKNHINEKSNHRLAVIAMARCQQNSVFLGTFTDITTYHCDIRKISQKTFIFYLTY